jgi:hypothetical protein
MVVNIDETGINVRPSSRSTFAKEGSIQVPVVAHGDKKQLTTTLAVSVLGDKLPAQVIYGGKTSKCLPKEEVPGVHYSYSKNHWQDLDSTKDLLNSVVFPYFKKKRTELGLPTTSTGLIIWDIWHTHINEEIIRLCDANHVKMVIVTPGFTGELQLLDVAGNHLFKKNYRSQFQEWFVFMHALPLLLFRMSAEVASTMNNEGANALNLGYKNLKPLIPKWVANAWEEVSKDVLAKGWNKIGIHDCWTEEWQERAEKERERYNCLNYLFKLLLRLSIPVSKKNALKPTTSDAMQAPPTESSSSESESVEELIKEMSEVRYAESASEESEEEHIHYGRIEAFMEKARSRERGCTSPCQCEKRGGTSKCICEKKGGCGPSCSCDPAKCRKKR